jgi:hypothetical protein
VFPPDDEVLQSDVYLERLLDAHRRVPRAVPRADEALDPELRRAAHALDRTLVRFHPSFRFEESLSARLRAAAETITGDERPPGVTIPFPFQPRVTGSSTEDGREAVQRLLVGGAIASGVSLAGAAAWLAWRRRSRPETAA